MFGEADVLLEAFRTFRREAGTVVLDREDEAFAVPRRAQEDAARPRAGAAPWRTAFSASGWRIMLGTRRSSQPASTPMSTWRRSRKRIR